MKPRTAEEVWDKMGDLPIPEGGKLNWIDYNRANLAILRAWQAEILEAAAAECEDHMGLESWATDADVTSEVGAAWDKASECCARGIRQMKEEP